MKAYSSAKLFIIIAWFCLALISCEKEEELGSVQNCVLYKFEEFQNGVSDNDWMQLEYNAQGYISKIIDLRAAYTLSGMHRVSSYTYNTQNQIVIEDFSEQNKGYVEFEYNPDGTIRMSTQHDENDPTPIIDTYIYDARKRLIKIVRDYGRGYTAPSVYEYVGESRNLAKEVHYDNNDTPMLTIIYEDYDNKRNPFLAVKGASPILFGESENNYRKRTTIYHDDDTEVHLYSYKYNSSGYVTESLEKEVGSQSQFKTIFSYSGCE